MKLDRYVIFSEKQLVAVAANSTIDFHDEDMDYLPLLTEAEKDFALRKLNSNCEVYKVQLKRIVPMPNNFNDWKLSVDRVLAALNRRIPEHLSQAYLLSLHSSGIDPEEAAATIYDGDKQ